MRDQRDLQRTQQHADALVRQVMTRDAAEPGFALAVARLLASKLPSADRPKPKKNDPASAQDIAAALIG